MTKVDNPIKLESLILAVGADMERFAVTVLRGITAHGRTV